MFCTKCGSQLADGSKFCTSCGAPQSAPAPAAAPAQPAPAPVQPAPAPVQTAVAPQVTYEAAVAGEVATKKKKKTGLIVGLIAAVVVLAALVCAFFFWIQPTFLSDTAKYEKAMDAAEAAMDAEDYETAIAEYKTALGYAADDDQKTAVYLARAEACVKAEEYEDAIADYEAVLEIDEDQKKIWALMADAYVALEDTEKAIEVLNEGYEVTEADTLLEKIEEIEAAANEGSEQPPADGGETDADAQPDDSTATDAPAMEEPSDVGEEPVAEQVSEVEIGGVIYNVEETWLDLSYMDLDNADIEALVYFTELEGLSLENNNISDLSPLADLQNLRYLYLYGNEISDLAPLSGLHNLEELSLWENPVEDLGPISGLYNLRFLDLDFTLVSDVTPLFGLTNLETLYVSGDNLPDDAWDMIYEALPQFAPEEPESIGAEFGFDTLYFGLSNLIPYEYMSSDPFQEFCYITCEMLSYELGLTPAPIGYSEPDVEILEVLAAGQIDCALVRLPVEYNDDLFEAYGLTWTNPIVETSSGSLVICVREDDYAMLDMLNIGIEMMWSDGLMEELMAIWEEYGLSVWY